MAYEGNERTFKSRTAGMNLCCGFLRFGGAKLWHVPYGAIKGTDLEAKIPAEFLKRHHR